MKDERTLDTYTPSSARTKQSYAPSVESASRLPNLGIATGVIGGIALARFVGSYIDDVRIRGALPRSAPPRFSSPPRSSPR